jgi:hypothetical protein
VGVGEIRVVRTLGTAAGPASQMVAGSGGSYFRATAPPELRARRTAMRRHGRAGGPHSDRRANRDRHRFFGRGYWAPSLVAAGFVIGTNRCLRPLVRRINRRTVLSSDAETYYTITLTCKSVEEAHLRSLLLHSVSQANLGLRRMDSADIPDTSKVAITAQAIATKRNDAALEQIVGRLSLEPHVTAATWQVDRAIPEA